MKIVHISTYDIQGGAARAAHRLHVGLQHLDQDSLLIARYRLATDESVVGITDADPVEARRQSFLLEQVIQPHYINAHRSDFGNTLFSLPYPGYDLSDLPQVQAADIINLHWITYFQSPVTLNKLLATGKPVIWTLHDQCPFTGGCHYTAGCQKYRQDCEACPQLSADVYDLPAAVLKDKGSYLRDGQLTIVAPSRWLAACAQESRLFEHLRVEVIPYSLDTNVFRPLPKSEAKAMLGLNADKVTLLFGAQDGTEKRKGFQVLLAASRHCLSNADFQQWIANDRLRILCFGYPPDELMATSIPTISLGQLSSDEDLSAAYSAADLFILPSLEDNLPNTLLEAMSCGIPVIASHVGGIPELVVNGVTGYLIPVDNAQLLGEAIISAILNPNQLTTMGLHARNRVEKDYKLEVQARRYLNLYTELCQTMAVRSPAISNAEGPSQVSTPKTPPTAPLITEVGPHFERIYQPVLMRALQEFAFFVHEKWQVSETDRAARLVSINELTHQLQESEADRAARLASIQELTRLLQESETDRAMHLGRIDGLTRLLQESEVARTELLTTLTAQVRQVQERQQELADLQQQFDVLTADHVAQADVIADQQKRLNEFKADQDQLHAEINYHNWRWNVLEPVLQGLRVSRAYRLMRRLGRWGWLEQGLAQTLPTCKVEISDNRLSSTVSNGRLKRIAVDLTPVMPGGENGGAKLVAMGLMQHLAQLAPDCEWVVLTADRNHEELSVLDSPNVQRICVLAENDPSSARLGGWTRVRMWIRDRLATVLPPRIMARLKSLYRKMYHRPATSSLPKRLGVDLVFCPFTAPQFYDPTVPMVIVVHDLQYLFYPQFFTDDDRYHRDKHFRESCTLATRLICVSDYVRGTVLHSGSISPAHVTTIHTRLFQRLTTVPAETVAQVMLRFGLQAERYLFYPANFWPHKNHEMLLVALGIYLTQNPQSNLKLVCTGAPGERLEFLRQATSRMKLEERVVFAGYVSDSEFAALLQACQALIFPSLYEGFGMPLLEAMAFDKPVLCSNVTSLPEIAGTAALLFDPRKPMEIVNAIKSIESDHDLGLQLKQQGAQRLLAFDQPAQMAQQYLQIFNEAVSGTRQFAPALHGIYADGWTSACVTVTHGASDEQRYLETKLTAPGWLPFEQVSVRISQNGHAHSAKYVIARGQTASLRHPLPRENGFVELVVDPVFQPQTYHMGDDARSLGCMYETFDIIAPTGILKLAERQP